MTVRPLVCQKCAALLRAPPRREFACSACGHVHKPAPEPTYRGDRNEDYEPGNKIVAEWGGRFWHGMVLRSLGDAQWEIQYRDWPPGYNEVVGYERLRWAEEEPDAAAADRVVAGTLRVRGNLIALGFAVLLALGVSAPIVHRYLTGTQGPPPVTGTGAPVNARTELRAGQAVLVPVEGTYYRARYVRPEVDDQAVVLRVGYGSASRITVARSQLLLPPNSDALSLPAVPQAVEPRGGPVLDPSTLSVGQPVHAFWHDRWLPATVVALEPRGAKVHFEGWDAAWDHAPRSGLLRNAR